MWYEIFVIFWATIYLTISFGIDAADGKWHYTKDALLFSFPLIVVTLCKILIGG